MRDGVGTHTCLEHNAVLLVLHRLIVYDQINVILLGSQLVLKDNSAVIFEVWALAAVLAIVGGGLR